MYSLWCEYDYGQKGLAFTSEKVAQDWFNDAWIKTETDSHGNIDWDYWGMDRNKTPFQNLYEQGLVGFVKLEIVGPRNAVPTGAEF